MTIPRSLDWHVIRQPRSDSEHSCLLYLTLTNIKHLFYDVNAISLLFLHYLISIDSLTSLLDPS